MSTTCEQCGRIRKSVPETEGKTSHSTPAYGYVVHDSYGCDTGCCGHRFILANEDGHELSSEFDFLHPYGDGEGFKQGVKEWAKQKHVHIHWDLCEISQD